MKFSEIFGVNLSPKDDWFDSILSVDTQLFLDPFLIYSGESGHFDASHTEIINFFNSVFRMIARSHGDEQSLMWSRAVTALRFPEVEEICLGYTTAGTSGSGSGGGIAKVIAAAIWEAIQAGVKELSHFEEIAILREGIGADRISDATGGIIRHRLAAYTLDVCRKHRIQTVEFNYLRGQYDLDRERWLPLHAQLPRNPYNNKGVLLVPKQYLRDLPTVNAFDFWDYAFVNENEAIRNDFSYDITTNLPKREIVEFAKRHPEARANYLVYREHRPLPPYSLSRDPHLLYRWYEASKNHVSQHPLRLAIEGRNDFAGAVDQMIEQYRHFIEQNKGWRLLWNDNNTPRREEAAQDLFLGIVKHYCSANNIDVSREADIGRGPVDFKASAGHSLRALIEVKLARNTRFWNGLEKQLPTYQKAEGIDLGYFLVVVYTEGELKKIKDLEQRVMAINERLRYTISAVTVDARQAPPSASKL